MLFSSLPCEFADLIRRTMSCFSCCFRIKDDHRPQINRASQTITAIHKEPVDPAASNSVWSVLASEVKDRDLSHCEDERYSVKGSPCLDDELRAEAKFLKACGTLPQTPVEIRRYEKSKDPQRHNGDPEPQFHSWLPNTAIEKAFEKQPDHLQLDAPIEEECIEQDDKESPQLQEKLQASITEKGSNVCPTLSPWLPSETNYESCTEQGLVPIFHGQTPGDRPILGVVNAYWNAEETPFTHKWGDGNGIPNTTNKYSEDQKVSWHATPFEERLEKALMNDKFIPKRKQVGPTPGTEF